MKKTRTKKLSGKIKQGGFTLMELLVSIAIFSIISVLMSNIVLNIAKFSLENERREDFLSELDTASNSIKNDLRGAAEIGLCSNGGMYYKSNNSTQSARPYYMLQKATVNNPDPAFRSSRLEWKNVQVDANKVCSSFVNPSNNPLNPDVVPVTSATATMVQSFDISTMAVNNIDPTAAKNSILFIRISACDPVNPNSSYVIFDCVKNPYFYQIAISTRIVIKKVTP